MKIIKVAIYARVSTSNGHQSPKMQLQALREYCEAREFKIYREYVDEGVSGAKDSRPALNELMDDARKRKFDTVLVWKFDRFARSTKHLISALEEFKNLGIDFISYSENIDTTSPLGRNSSPSTRRPLTRRPVLSSPSSPWHSSTRRSVAASFMAPRARRE